MRAPKARSSRAVALPMPPNPTTEQIAPSKVRENDCWSHLPAASAACRCGRRFASARVIANTCSAMGSANAPTLLAKSTELGTAEKSRPSTPAQSSCTNSTALAVANSSLESSADVAEDMSTSALARACSRSASPSRFTKMTRAWSSRISRVADSAAPSTP